jgi:YVTN family beta-propeller protein
MRNRIKLLLLAAAGMIVPVGLLTAVGVQPASAAGPVSLPISSYYQMAVDAAHGHIFISQGSSSQNGILVTDLTGQVVTTITGQTGVVGIALSPDGSTLYAALSGADAVTAISTATLTQTASYPLPAGDSPFNVAVQSGKVWVSYNNTASLYQSGVGYFDPSAASPSLQAPANMTGWIGAPQIAADPEDTGVLVAVGTGTGGTGLASYDTAADPVSTIAGSPGSSPPICQEEDLAVAPGGAEFAVACHTNPADNVYSTSSLSLLSSLSGFAYPSFPNSVAYDSAGDIAAGSFNNLYTPDLYIYPQGSATAVNAYDMYSLGTQGGILEPRGLAWMPDGSQLFGVLSVGTSFALAVIQNPTVPQQDPTSTAVTYCANQVIAVGQAETCYAVVTDATPGGTTPTGVVTFTSDTSGGSFSSSSCTLSPDQTLAQAACAVTYTPGQIGSGTQTITANYSGDSHHLASSGQASLVVTPHYTSTAVNCSPDTVAVGQATSCTATVQDNTYPSPTTPTGVVTFTSDTSGGSFSSNSCTLSAASISGQATCSFSYTPGEAGSGTQTLTASYGGDGTHAASSGQAAVTVTLRVTSTVLTCTQVRGSFNDCTATVTDISPGSATAPSGTVSFASSGPGYFNATQCTLSGNGTSTSCAVSYKEPAGGPKSGQTITAYYVGDSTHQASTGSATLT